MTQSEAVAWIAQIFEMAPDQLSPDTGMGFAWHTDPNGQS